MPWRKSSQQWMLVSSLCVSHLLSWLSRPHCIGSDTFKQIFKNILPSFSSCTWWEHWYATSYCRKQKSYLSFFCWLLSFIKVFEICFIFYNYNSHLFSVSSKFTYIEYSSPVISPLQAIFELFILFSIRLLGFYSQKFFSGSLLSLFQLAWFLSRSICTAAILKLFLLIIFLVVCTLSLILCLSLSRLKNYTVTCSKFLKRVWERKLLSLCMFDYVCLLFSLLVLEAILFPFL